MIKQHVQSWADGTWSVKELLNDADSAFKTLNNKHIEVIENGIDRKFYNMAASQIGCQVLDPTTLVVMPKHNKDGTINIDDSNGIPPFTFNGINRIPHLGRRKKQEAQKGERCAFVGVLASRITRLPINVSATGPGQPYEVTCIYGFVNKSYCVTFCMTINKGVLYPAKCLMYVPRNVGGHSYNSRTWQVPPFLYYREKDKYGEKASVLECAAALIPQGSLLDTHWHLRIEKGGKMVNVVLADNTAKHLFSSRDKVGKYMTQSGRRRPIIHWVKSHHRKRNERLSKLKKMLRKLLFWRKQKKNVSNVKTHLRGVREFLWNGYKCTIVIPGLHRVTLKEWGWKIWYEYKERQNINKLARTSKYYPDIGPISGARPKTENTSGEATLH